MSRAKSHGRARTELPRSRELRPVETVPDRAEGRGSLGRFAPGNRISVRAGEKRAAKKLLGAKATDPDVLAVARDAERAFRGALRELPSDGQVVRSLAALYGRHLAASAYYAAKADEAGPATEQGIKLAELAMRHGARAERLAVTALDVATTLAKARPAAPFPWLAAAPRADASGGEDDAEDDGQGIDTSTRHPGAGNDIDDDGEEQDMGSERKGDTRVSPPVTAGVRPQPSAKDAEPPEGERGKAPPTAHRLTQATTRWNPVTQRQEPIPREPATPAPVGVSLERSPSHPAPSGPPARPLPRGAVPVQVNGHWTMGPPPKRTRPTRAAVEEMRRKGTPIRPEWLEDDDGNA